MPESPVYRRSVWEVGGVPETHKTHHRLVMMIMSNLRKLEKAFRNSQHNCLPRANVPESLYDA